MVVRVRDVEFSIRMAYAAGFVERWLSAVRLSGFARAEERLDRAFTRVKLFDLVIVRVCDQDFSVQQREAERMLQTHIVARAVLIAKLEEVAARERAYRR